MKKNMMKFLQERKEWALKDRKLFICMDINIDIKTLIAIIAAVGVLGGFYYTTQLRLDHLESEIERIEKIAKRRNK